MFPILRHIIQRPPKDSRKAPVLQSNPTPSNYYNLGICYEALGMYDEAEKQYKNAINLKPKDQYIEALAGVKKLKEEKKILKERER
ncbi:MAG: tetratricopeptide repeat protein [Deltaproteobacteria bacterium]|nr:tetratricopeptide repeat protein [Deltaproteobacteria bacterium]